MTIDWTDDTPLRLKDAAALAFPNGGMTAAGLRREAEKGRLVMERIAGKDYVSLKAIAEMREKCRVKPKPHPMDGWKAPQPEPPLPFGLTGERIANMALDKALANLTTKRREFVEQERAEREKRRLKKAGRPSR
ncbi:MULTISPECIES: excisionase [unclassified Bradyrhizobium]|uniref:excisionase n=1 Tax=unclassified Bradyrhizobium TaxID=2631580 RepID=UPI002479B881|nr:MULTISPECIES: excisionase [unclassified Bradyrhizobium]WGS18936.1 excisionase [Bradyrhizobium sp. ISRA463]WGS25769.1 excisionase [Bradyrhizobium sp. ISRA464]